MDENKTHISAPYILRRTCLKSSNSKEFPPPKKILMRDLGRAVYTTRDLSMFITSRRTDLVSRSLHVT